MLIPRLDGVILSQEWKTEYWVNFARERHDHALYPSNSTAVAGFDRDAEEGTRDQPKVCFEVA